MTTGTSHGYNIQTALIASLDGNRTTLAPLYDPFPSGIAVAPGASLGAATLLGRAPNFSNPDFDVPYVDQVSIGLRRDLPWSVSSRRPMLAAAHMMRR